MLAKNLVVALLSASATASALPGPFDRLLARRADGLEIRQNRGGQNNGGNKNGQNNGGNNGGNNNGGNNGGNCLNPNVIQKASASPGGASADKGQANSKTDNNNFINFCQGTTLTDGKQVKTGSCNGIPMGKIPAQANMVSSILQNPKHNDNIQANTNFDITVQMRNFAPGTFTNPDTTYYSAPQDLDGSGKIIGHTHVTVQDLGNTLTPNQPPDASQFVFFKGINDAGNGNGQLKATVTGGLPAGNYRVCTMSSSANHQPVLMPVAQRGAQDDCNKFTVGGNGGNNNGGNNNGGNNGGQNKGGNNGAQNNGGQNNGGQNKGGQGRARGRQ